MPKSLTLVLPRTLYAALQSLAEDEKMSIEDFSSDVLEEYADEEYVDAQAGDENDTDDAA